MEVNSNKNIDFELDKMTGEHRVGELGQVAGEQG